ncbi:MAG TPA: YbaN family protein [Acidimicrobiales bacterium]|nr:YbaN family protein [Acidimicrobiales bacterium]
MAGGGSTSGDSASTSGGECDGRRGRRMLRWVWLVLGWLSVALGGVGVVVPGWPTTVFFIAAASCFARSSPRFERWVLGLPGIGPLVRDHRAGLGMPRRAKVVAVSMIVVAVAASVVLAISAPLWRLVVVALGLVGVAYVGFRVPTREVVLARSSGSE